MKAVNYGSLNYDRVYSVEHLAGPGETVVSTDYNQYFGGKGLNQSVALARAGARVMHAGMVGEDGEAMLELCDENSIDRSLIKGVAGASGHAIIEVSSDGENNIILFAGANGKNTREYIAEAMSCLEKGDYLILQNEVNLVDVLIDEAYKKDVNIVLNPSPYNAKLDTCDISKVTLLMLNEVEGLQMTGEKEPERILDMLQRRYPKLKVVLTLGKQGSIYMQEDVRLYCPSVKVDTVDTTAAGDTFTGYFIAGLMNGDSAKKALSSASRAASIAVGRRGAIPSIPYAGEL